MKTFLNKLLKGRITRWGFLAVLLIAAGLTVAGMNQRQYRFGGGWIGTDGATTWSVLQIPIDPEGRKAAIRVNSLAGGLGNTEATGEGEMINRDTAKWTLMAYVNTQDNPPQISQIWVIVGTLKFTGPDSWEIKYDVNIYPAAADLNKDGFPEVGTPSVISGLTGTAKRVSAM